ncbi:MAG: potassium-transporting ATPase subunit KdpB, partial [Paucibacter sp.]|nr:potassium-transporting ATPase subunit KdpB [Roseateles sp.]
MKRDQAFGAGPSTAGRRGGPRTAGYSTALFVQAGVDSLKKFDPRVQVRNPVMFVVWIGAWVTAALTADPALFGPSNASRMYNGALTLILALTVWFANFAEALAEGRGKAKAAALRQTSAELKAQRVRPDGKTEWVAAAALRKDDLVRVDKDQLVPIDGEVIEGVAYVDESVITGESAPVLKELGSDVSSGLTGGTRVISDSLLMRVTANPGETFLDRMIHLVESARRQKTPNEIALTVLLSVLTLIFVIVVAAMAPVADYLKARINIADLIALIVALIPTTIGALLSAIGIAGIDRAMRFNLLAMSGKAVEVAGDVHTLILDKTGTITMGNRQATEFVPLGGHSQQVLVQAAFLASWFDTTPEGRSIVARARTLGAIQDAALDQASGTDFSAETRMSGTNLPSGAQLRKGAVDAVVRHVQTQFGSGAPTGLDAAAERIASQGATPLAVAMDGNILGLIALSDVLKPGIRERAMQLHAMGIRTVMVTGDNPTTA